MQTVFGFTLATCIWDWYASDKNFVELRVVAGRSRPRASSPHARSRRPCCAVALRRTAWWVWHGRGMASVNQTRPYCVNQIGKTHSKTPLAARHGRGTAWARHGNGMLCVNRPIACRVHAVPLPWCAAKGLECVFPVWYTQCGRVWFTLAMPRPCYAPTMPFFSRPPCKPNSHPYRITSTNCRKHKVVSPDDGHIVARNMYRLINILRINIIRINFATSWLYLQVYKVNFTFTFTFTFTLQFRFINTQWRRWGG
jgi:hypothetical protein